MSKLKPENIETLISRDRIQSRVRELGQQITRDYKGNELMVVGVLRGAFIFTADLIREIDLPIVVDFLQVSSYAGTETSGVVRFEVDLGHSIEGRDVLIVEDVIDTGLTMRYLLDHLKLRNPRSIKICALLSKPSRARVVVAADYAGFEIGDRFVVGYGLDFDQHYRNLPYIGAVKEPL